MTTIGFEYTGEEDRHRNDSECQEWTSQDPNLHPYTSDADFPDATVADASNHCRQVDGPSKF